jgi:hypothetical protein
MRVKARMSPVLPDSFISTSGPMISRTSPPDEKFSPAPVTITARTSVTYESARKVSVSSPYDSKVSGFFRSGRFSVIVATRPARSQRK